MPGTSPVVFQAHVLAPNAVCAVHEPTGCCRKNLNWAAVQVVAVAVNVTVAPGACGEAAPGLIEADVQVTGGTPLSENATTWVVAPTKIIPSPAAGVAKCPTTPVLTLVIGAPVAGLSACSVPALTSRTNTAPPARMGGPELNVVFQVVLNVLPLCV